MSQDIEKIDKIRPTKGEFVKQILKICLLIPF